MHNNRHAALVFPLLLIGALATAAYADIAAGARSAIHTAYNKQNAALDREDAGGALASTSPDFMGTDAKGECYTLQTRKDGLAATFSLVKSMSTHTRIVAFTLQPAGTAADIEAVERQAITIQNPQTGQEQSGVMDMTVQDHWVSTTHGWMLQSRRQLNCNRID
ncbi:MAG: hypothetical protein JWQ02_3571 [Capsulimonas sp.]|jgi:hypothetical protein|nr:hypothetical protein [Capsulimonas sp.]